ncbi:hypothetical protein HHI36_004157, partial [Cryptolaemus montrouzieri]
MQQIERELDGRMKNIKSLKKITSKRSLIVKKKRKVVEDTSSGPDDEILIYDDSSDDDYVSIISSEKISNRLTFNKISFQFQGKKINKFFVGQVTDIDETEIRINFMRV